MASRPIIVAGELATIMFAKREDASANPSQRIAAELGHSLDNKLMYHIQEIPPCFLAVCKACLFCGAELQNSLPVNLQFSPV